MGFTLILSEKRETAERIAGALDEGGRPKSYREQGIPYFEAIHRGQTLRIVPAIGHLYTVAPREKGYSYPVLEVEWVPAYRFSRRLGHTRRWIEAIEKISRGASAFISATDYDVEGEVIGYTVLRFACGGKEKEAKRMIFSTLTKGELQKAFQNLAPTIDFRLAEAGETRHVIDFLWGINVSRALTLSLRNNGKGFTKLSAGRVQGPTLGFVVEREREINSFVPTPYWRISALLEVEGRTYRVEYLRPRIATLKEAQKIMECCLSKEGVVKSIASKTYEEHPPPPFNLENLQAESYRIFKHPPSGTLRLAEGLYLEALISYPRTSSEKIPPTVNCEEIIKSLGQSREYQDLTSELLEHRPLHLNQGKGHDPAHPAIYPTGNRPEATLDRQEARLLDLIVRRFLSAFAPAAVSENVRITFDLNGETFFLTGRRTLKEGWLRFYSPYARREENPAPALREGELVRFKEVICIETYTAPPPRFNPASLLQTMEERELGTKATRAGIIDTLGARGYISGERMTATELGLGVYETLHEYCPVLVSVEFTRDLEQKMEAIQRGEGHKQEVIDEALSRLTEVLDGFKANEAAIAGSLSRALSASDSPKRTIGPCPVCRRGRLQIIHSRRTGKRFAGCTNYKDGCTAAFPLPQPPYKIWTTKKSCRACGWPTMTVKSPARRPWSLCLNPDCPTKTSRNRR
jgi:DNA topoisomerase-1